jgi:general stress protein YciG
MAERGGTHEQHQQAGHAGGMATKERHQGEGFYEEIGRKGGEARGASQNSAEQTTKTASQSKIENLHGAAAQSHSQLMKNTENTTTSQKTTAQNTSSPRGGTSEQHAEAGRQSHKKT